MGFEWCLQAEYLSIIDSGAERLLQQKDNSLESGIHYYSKGRAIVQQMCVL